MANHDAGLLLAVLVFEVITIGIEVMVLLSHAQMVRNMNVTAKVCNLIVSKIDYLGEITSEKD